MLRTTKENTVLELQGELNRLCSHFMKYIETAISSFDFVEPFVDVHVAATGAVSTVNNLTKRMGARMKSEVGGSVTR